MNPSAYFTTGLAIKTLTSLSKADVVIHGEENIPGGPTIFVINHFTRIETLLIPYYIYNLTTTPVFSLADESLFRGSLKKLLDMIGVISTRDPNRDKIILKGLLTGSENWIIFPEGRMVKTKKIIGGGKFLIRHDGGSHKPHTGAASLALRAEFLRHHLLAREKEEPANVQTFLDAFSIASLDDIRGKATTIVPVNLTYYPIRAKENIASQFAARMMKEVPERMLEELMTEGTMLLSGVDLDIHFGKPIGLEDFLSSRIVGRELQHPFGEYPHFSERLSRYMRSLSEDMMQRYMKAIYNMTSVNHEHLFASFLQRYPFSTMKEMDLRRRVYLAVRKISDKNAIGYNLHRSLQEEQVHLLTDDRFKKVENFIELALEKNVVEKKNGYLVKLKRKLPELLLFHRGRIDNPIEVMANEVEPLRELQRLVRLVAWQPGFLVRRKVLDMLVQEEDQSYLQDCKRCGVPTSKSGSPFLLRGSTGKIGVVLVHSYLSVPEEVMELARYLNRQGLWVYAPRLAGHGTTPEDLAQKTYSDWQLSVEKGYAVISSICEHVVLGGVSVGGCLVLELASRLKKLAGVVAVCPPLHLKDYSSSFMPGNDVWTRILAKIKKDDLDIDYFQFNSENIHVNYDKNPILGVKNVGAFLEKLKTVPAKVHHPSLILQADRNPIVGREGSRQIYDELGTEEKEYILLNYKNHIIIRGEDSGRVHAIIGDFIRNLVG
ncbi:alpha/beta fold hydrolase [Desulfopila inferna]|uniref:alpha/beta fold hydrolase n=1 Tax=Desulfopila inferna TaxID=468528 RepID=UPI0019648D7E|nr:alpha/beta fold hydrolase [Desulfopila inferna]MBM9603681.1 alpha/beta fold hydrolase [Desulfopila inferna]